MKSKKVLIPVVLLLVLAVALGLFWAKQKSEEREVLVSQEVIPAKEEPKKPVTEGLVAEEIKEEGRNFQLKLVAEVKADPRTLYDTLVDFENLIELIPDCTKFEVVESEGNRRVIYQKRFILFMGKEMGGNVEYTLYPEDLKFRTEVLRDPNAKVIEHWSIEGDEDKARVTYLADVKPKLKVPIFMAQAWIKENFVDLMKAVKDKLEGQPASG
jgi:ribosome-associated toxin RatA of RatAB toxin-antitoxin module